MAESKIPVDLLNPGQVFACLGLMETTVSLWGHAKAIFHWENASPSGYFILTTEGTEDPVHCALQFLAEAQVEAQAPHNSKSLSDNSTVPIKELEPGAPFPYPDLIKKAKLPAILRNKEGCAITIDHWGEDKATRRDNVKFWAGMSGKGGAELLKDLLEDALSLIQEDKDKARHDPFSLCQEQKSSFRFDWRRDYIPLDAGFSPNKHTDIVMVGFPIVEIFAAIGLSNARPRRNNKLCYTYGILGGGKPFDPIFHRAALGADVSPAPDASFRRFNMKLNEPAKDARCITSATEIRGG